MYGSYYRNRKEYFLCLFMAAFWGFSTGKAQSVAGSGEFWEQLQKLCGKSFSGEVVTAPVGDTVFAGKQLVMEVRACGADSIRIPFHVGNDRSRTWVISKHNGLLRLVHDHRHADGTPDRVTRYGGLATHAGSATVQYFPADAYTAALLPAAGSNVWWIELLPGKSFTYHLQRLGTDRKYAIRFNLVEPVAAPPAPWGWKD